jgi:Fe2+ transport system protein FeoA
MSVKLLSKLGSGERGRIVRICGEAGMHRLLFELGLFIGRSVSVENTGASLLGEPLQVKVKERVFSLEKEIAANIYVRVA